MLPRLKVSFNGRQQGRKVKGEYVFCLPGQKDAQIFNVRRCPFKWEVYPILFPWAPLSQTQALPIYSAPIPSDIFLLPLRLTVVSPSSVDSADAPSSVTDLQSPLKPHRSGHSQRMKRPMSGRHPGRETISQIRERLHRTSTQRIQEAAAIWEDRER